jgi:release factor glutamine methyltransferase
MENHNRSLLKRLESGLLTIYSEREAATIARYVFEDLWQISEVNLDNKELDEAVFETVYRDLIRGRPWQYVVGVADFYGERYKVNEAVLIPRSETEELVDLIIKEGENYGSILDIGTGSGCIAIALEKALTKASVTAVDVSVKALTLAEENASKLSANVLFSKVDILDQSKWEEFEIVDAIVSNPPYILEEERSLMPDYVLNYEPPTALFVTDNDPLQFYRAIADFAVIKLTDKGVLYFEINEFFGLATKKMLEEKGFEVEVIKDFYGKDRVVRAVKFTK